jgi:ribosome-associated protein
MQIEALKKLAVEALENLKGQNIVEIDVRGKSTVTDFMVLATGTSNRHVKALVNSVHETVKEQGLQPWGNEGAGVSDWCLLDLGDVVVHVMTESARGFYDLERLWGEPRDTDS